MSKFGKMFRKATVSQDGPDISRRRVVTTVAALAAGIATVAAGPRPGTAAAAIIVLGTVWWVKVQTPDLERCRAFYSHTLGWTSRLVALDDMARSPVGDEKPYVLFMVEGREVAGAIQSEDVAVASWLTYIQVGNVDAAALKAVELGAKLLEPPTDVPNTGRIAVLQDPAGARIGLITIA